MPNSDPEPENYSIDEMMERLRSGGAAGRDGEPELVVRDDGSQMYRMRKRKRRSHQPKKEKEKMQRRLRVFQVVLAAGLVAICGLAVVGSVLYLSSSAYRDSILSRIREWTGAEPQVTQFRVTPVSAAAGSVELTWPEGSILESLKLNGVRGDLRISSMFGGGWKGSEMVAPSGGTLVLRSPSGVSPPALPVRSGECPFQFRFRSPAFTVLMGGNVKPDVRLSGSEATLSLLDPEATTANLQFEGGNLQVAGWGDFQLGLASFQVEPSGIRLGTLRMAAVPGEKGEIEILNPEDLKLDLKGGETAMELRITRVPLSKMMGPAFGDWLSSTIESPEEGDKGGFRFKGGPSPSFSCRVPFRSTAVSESRASRLPLLPILAKELGESWYRTPRFDLEFAGTVVRDSASSAIDDLDMEARGRLAIKGWVKCAASGALDGVLVVGIPEAALATASVPLRRVFDRIDHGYAWAEIALSGTGAVPADDLAKQLQDAAINVAPASGGTEGLEEGFRELTTPEDR